MNLSEPFIKKPVMTILVMISILFFGLFAYRNLPVSDLPNVEFPTITVTVSYPGANPQIVTSSCAVPLEKELMTIDGIQTLFSISRTGSLTMVAQFDLNKSMDTAAVDVQAAIDRALPNLPNDLPYNPTYRKINPSQTPILYIAITSESMDVQDLYDYANTYIGQRLNTISGVSEIVTFGDPYAARIQIDPGKLAHIGLSMQDVVSSIQKQNVNLPTGVLYGPNQETTINIYGQLLKAKEYEDVALKTDKGKVAKIGDVGRALRSLDDDKYSLTYRTKKRSDSCIVLGVQTLPNANAVDVANAIFQKLPELEKELPSSLRYHTIYNKKAIILDSLNDVQNTLIIAFILVVLIIYLFFGKLLNTIIPSFALPMSILGTFCALYLLGFNIDILSLLALTLSVGFLVDDAIVVLENNIRHVHLGLRPKDAAIKGSKEISITVLSMTLCLITVFTPMLFLNSILGRLFREFAVTIVVAVLFSGCISLTLTPLLCSRFISKQSSKKKNRMQTLTERLQKSLLGGYEKALNWALEKRKWILCLGALSLLGSFWLLKEIPTDFLPNQDEGFIQGFTQSRDGTSPFKQKALQNKIIDLCLKDPAVESVVSLTSAQGTINDNQGLFFIKLKPLEERRSVFVVIEDLIKKVNTVPGIDSYMSPIPLINLTLGTTTKALYQYSLTGIDTKILYPAVENLVEKMQSAPEIFRQISSDLQIRQPMLDLTIDRSNAAKYKLNAEDVEHLFSYAYSDNRISTIDGPIDQYDVLVETMPEFYKDERAFSYLFLKNPDGKIIPLKQVIDTKKTAGPLTITRINSLPAATISFNLAPGVPLGTALNAINQYTKNLPTSIQGKSEGTAAVFESSFRDILILFAITIFVIYVILGILYESFIHPITVMSALPPAAFGGLFSLYILGESLSIFSFVGLIMLIGIVMKNGIMMIDFANENTLKGLSSLQAIHDACLVRFRPILMTTIAALVGALPIALGLGGPTAATRAPLGVVVVGGLIFSQALTLFLTPVIFYYLDELKNASFFKKRKAPSKK